jgi:histidyl-tRNA synthetase
MNTETIKGFRDFDGEEAEKRAEIKKILIGVFEKYGFEPAETPIVESEEFVKGENEKDEAVSDIFKLKDKGQRNLALRYEFTFQLKRLAKNKKLPYKRYQIGEVFRDEPISSNRFRQFTQCDIDIIGSSIKDEAEILNLAKKILDELGIKFTIYINNRKLLNEILEKERINEKDREQVIREIDKMDKLSEKEISDNLKKYNAEKLLKIFKNPETYFKKYEYYSEIEELVKYCRYYGVKVNFSPSLARGFSYYNGSVFEIKTNEIKETITAGGSYSVNGISSTGISFGLDRVSSLAKIKNNKEKIMLVSLGENKKVIEIAEKIRNNKKICLIYYGKPSKALEYADSKKIDKIVFIGKDEIKKKKFKIKDMKTGKEKIVGEKELMKI